MEELAGLGKSMLYQEAQKREFWEFRDGMELKGPLTHHQICLEYFFL